MKKKKFATAILVGHLDRTDEDEGCIEGLNPSANNEQNDLCPSNLQCDQRSRDGLELDRSVENLRKRVKGAGLESVCRQDELDKVVQLDVTGSRDSSVWRVAKTRSMMSTYANGDKPFVATSSLTIRPLCDNKNSQDSRNLKRLFKRTY